MQLVLSEIPDVLHYISLIARFGSEKKFPWGHIDSVLRFYFIVLFSAFEKEIGGLWAAECLLQVSASIKIKMSISQKALSFLQGYIFARSFGEKKFHLDKAQKFQEHHRLPKLCTPCWLCSIPFITGFYLKKEKREREWEGTLLWIKCLLLLNLRISLWKFKSTAESMKIKLKHIKTGVVLNCQI